MLKVKYKERSCYHPMCFMHKVGGKNVITPDFLVTYIVQPLSKNFLFSEIYASYLL
jgi:hypothetical protein